MRGNAEYFGQLKAKNMMQEEVRAEQCPFERYHEVYNIYNACAYTHRKLRALIRN